MPYIEKLFIGTLDYMREAPLPQFGMTAEMVSYSQMMQLEAGGIVGVRSNQYHMKYNLSFVGTTDEVIGIDHYVSLRAGIYGTGNIYFNNPYDYSTNLLAPGWASPGLSKNGWYSIFSPSIGTLTYSATGSSVASQNQPTDTASYQWTSATGAPPEKYRHVVVIPPGYRLLFGWSGSAVGTGGISIRGITVADGRLTSIATVPAPLPAAGAIRTNVEFSGSTYKAVEIYASRSTADATAKVNVTSMMAQLQPLGEPLAHVTGPHRRGNGHTGVMFSDDTVVENYVFMYPPRKGISTTMEEVGAWLQ
jgi:hypothetical protein